VNNRTCDVALESNCSIQWGNVTIGEEKGWTARTLGHEFLVRRGEDTSKSLSRQIYRSEITKKLTSCQKMKLT